MMPSRILVCDEEENTRRSLALHLRAEGFNVDETAGGDACCAKMQQALPDAVLLDLGETSSNSMDCLRRVRALKREIPVVVIAPHNDRNGSGALALSEFEGSALVTRPFEMNEISQTLHQSLGPRESIYDIGVLRGFSASGYDAMVGEAPAIKRVFSILERLESVDAPTILVTGESGTGKDLVAHAIHHRGTRSERPFMAVDCAALPALLIESELFGHERGAVAEARNAKRGLLEVARGGTLYLDGIGEMAPTVQAKLMRALESGIFRRMGGVVDLPLDLTLIAACNRDLRVAVAEGAFRKDLYVCLSVIEIASPALRERLSDIPLLVAHFLAVSNRRLNRQMVGVTHAALAALARYRWPGNIRELRNVIERVVILEGRDETLRLAHLPQEIRVCADHLPTDAEGAGSSAFMLPEGGVNLEEVERSLIDQALDRTEGNQSAAARLLGISRYALRYRMEKYKD